MMDKSENRTRPYRTFGVIRYTFPEMTPTEKAFLGAFVFCGLVAAIVVRRSMSGSQYAIAGVSLCIMGSVLSYWMRHEPAAFLQLFLFPYTGWQFK
jgi:ABC-type cobalamin transport system permease subunit